MIKFIFLLTPLILIIYHFFSMRKRLSISYEIRYGLKCYSCKRDLEWTQIQPLVPKIENIKICKVCSRDEKLNSLSNKININLIKRFLLSKISDKVQNIFLLLSIIFIFIDAFLSYRFGIKWFWIFNSLSNLLFWIIFFSKYDITTIKKPSNN